MWEKIITQNSDSIKSKIKEIAQELKNSEIHKDNIGLLGGNSGLLLFIFYYAKYSKDAKYEELGYELVENIFDSMNNNVPSVLFSSGIAGVGWIIKHLVKNNFFEVDTDSIFSDVDEALYNAMMENINLKEYDYLHGALGLGMYFLSKSITDKIKKNLTDLINRLEEIGINEGENKIKWIYPYELNENNITVYNLSLSHGIASIIGFLSKCYEKGIHQDKSKELATKSVNYLLSHKLDINNYNSYFPSWIEPDKELNSSRLAWCYGDMGIAIALYQAGEIFQNKEWEKQAIQILLHNIKRKDQEDTHIMDAGLCHGSAGIAHIFNRIYNYTKINEFKDASIFWVNETLKLATYEDGLAGFKQYSPTGEKEYVNSYNFLEGIAGIGLSLMATISDIEPAWDECLLLS